MSDLEHHLPSDVARALKATESDEIQYDNEEELAVISCLICRGGRRGLEEALAEEPYPNDPFVLCDLEWSKQQGNQAFAAGDWMGALQHYAVILKTSEDFNRSSRQHSIAQMEQLLATTHANTAQTLLNLARNDEAAQQCHSALQIPALFEKPALHQKVMHRLKQCQQPPSPAARLAATQAESAPVPCVEVNEKELDFVQRHSRGCGRAVAEYTYQMAEGQAVLAIAFLSVSEHEEDFDSISKNIREFALQHGVTRRIQQGEVERLMELRGLGPKLAKRRAKQAKARERGQELMSAVVLKCQEEVWSACLNENVAQTNDLLMEPREWLSTRDTRAAVPFFLAAADRIAMVPLLERKVAKNTIACYRGKPSAVRDLRATVEITWMEYVGALNMLEIGEIGPSSPDSDDTRPRWEDVEYERVRHVLRLSRGLTEPEETVAPQLREAVSNAMKAVPDETPKCEDSPVASPKAAAPSLQDLCGYKIKRSAQISAVKRGLRYLKEQEEACGDDLFFDCRQIACERFLDRRIATLKRDYKGSLPVVDKTWHVCFYKRQGMATTPFIEVLPMAEVEKNRPACIFVTNRSVPCPPPEMIPYGMGLFGRDEIQTLPQSTVAVQYFSDDTPGLINQNHLIRRVLIKAVEGRGGRPKNIAVGPIGTRELWETYLYRGGGGPPPGEIVEDNDDDDCSYSDRSIVEAFIADDLQVQHQWIEGIWDDYSGNNQAHEERPRKQTPAQYREVLRKQMEARNS